MVDATTAEYTAAVLYSFALASEVDPGGQFTLSDRQAEVAFRLAKVWRAAAGVQAEEGSGDGAGAVPGGGFRRGAGLAAGMASGGDLDMNARHSEANSEDDEEETPPLAWEQPEEPLPEDLGLVLQRFQHHGLQFPAKEVLDCCPKWSGLKTKAEANNYKNDGARAMDRNMKMMQQKLLGLQKIYPILHMNLNDNEEVQQLGQKFCIAS